MKNEAKAKAGLMELKKAVQPRLYPTHQQLQAAFKAEEIWLACNYKARTQQFASDGLNVRPSYPKEGGIGITFGASMPKRARNKDNAYFYLNALLDPVGMANLVQASFYTPANKTAPLPAEFKEKISFTDDEQKRLHFQDHEFMAKVSSPWLEWWNKEFKA